MGYILKLKQGARELDLSSGIYTLDQWIPPRANIISNVAHGTSANRYGGGQKVSERAVNTSTVFSVRISGGSNAECEAGARSIENFLRRAGDESDPVYLDWRPDTNVSAEPLWGQFGANIHYEIVSGSVDRWNAYFINNVRNTTMFVNVLLELKPFALGSRQKLLQAKGGIFEDTIGVHDGESKGITIGNAMTNIFSNPVFGHATWDNSWTTGSELISEQNTDPELILFGNSSARLTGVSAGTRTFAQVLTAGTTSTHILSYYAKLQDGGTIGTAVCGIIHNGTTPTASYLDVGNGWYRVYGAFAAAGTAPVGAGAFVQVGYTIYADGFQLEESALAYPSYAFNGDMLGCYWSGTAHASTSVRNVGYLRAQNDDSSFMRITQGTFRIAIKWNVRYDYSANMVLFDDSTAGLTLFYQASSDKFILSDGTNNAGSAAQTFEVGDITIIHAIWGQAGLAVYVNGSDTGASPSATIALAALGDYMYVGTDSTPIGHLKGRIMGVATYAQEMTAAEIAADYANIIEAIGNDHRLESLPWLWTKDGDNILDNGDSGAYQNWAIIGGIPGNVPADTIIIGDWATNHATDPNTNYFSLLDMDNYIDPSFLIDNTAGTFVVTGTALPMLTNAIELNKIEMNVLKGKQAAIMLTGYDSCSDLKLATRFTFGAAQNITTSYISAALGGVIGERYIDNTPFITIPKVRSPFPNTSTGEITAFGSCTASNGTVFVNSLQIITRPFARIDNDTSSGGIFYLNNRLAYETSSVTTPAFSAQHVVIGDPIEFVPNKYNALIYYYGKEESISDIDDNVTLYIHITPRWSLA